MLICWTAVVIPASAQHFKQIDGSLTQIAVGRAEAWGLNGSEIYRFDSSTQKFNQISGSLAQIAVGGGLLLQPDEVWGVNASGSVYRFNFSKNAFDKVSGDLKQIAVSEGDDDNCHPYEVWGIDPDGNVWRYNYCESHFNAMPTAGPMAHVAVGPSGVWGLDVDGGIWQLFPTTYIQAYGADNNTLQQIAVGANDDVWGTDNGWIYRYYSSVVTALDGFSGFSGTCETAASTTCEISQVAAGGDGVWVVDSYNQGVFPYVGIARLTYSTPSFPSSYEFFANEFSMPALGNSVVQLAVGSGGGVWAIISRLGPKYKTSYQVYAFVRP
jgi:hypothetical protein